MSEVEKFVISDPDGVFLTLSRDEAEMILEDLRDDEDLSPALMSMRTQLEEWLT
jgi:hypothetical protein